MLEFLDNASNYWHFLLLSDMDKIEYIQGLIQKEKAHINFEKGVLITILLNKIATQWWSNIIIKESEQTPHYIYFLFSRYYIHIMLLIWSKKLELCLMVVSVLFDIKFGYAQISVPKISTSMSKTACINPWYWWKILFFRKRWALFF